jgi:hypothetical protein
MNVGDRAILWEDIGMQLAFKAGNRPTTCGKPIARSDFLGLWGQSVADLGSA